MTISNLDRYVEAGSRENTRRSYASATRHFEVDWGGHLPATPDTVARYLVSYADQLAINTLKHRLAALAQWHSEHGFTDPTRAPIVKKVIKGIKALHPRTEKRAAPLQLDQLGLVVDWLAAALLAATSRGDHTAALRHARDRALLLLGFWRGFRGDELSRLRVEHLKVFPGQGMTCYLQSTKGDRQNAGTTFKVPALSRWCPVAAVSEWVSLAELTEGTLFPRINRWGTVGSAPMSPNSMPPLLRRMFSAAGLASPEKYSGHSLRRGFAGWASANGWDVKSLMEYVGWRDVHSAMRYIESADPFGAARIELGLDKAPLPVRQDDR